jgi:hypothetical protein
VAVLRRTLEHTGPSAARRAPHAGCALVRRGDPHLCAARTGTRAEGPSGWSMSRRVTSRSRSRQPNCVAASARSRPPLRGVVRSTGRSRRSQRAEHPRGGHRAPRDDEPRSRVGRLRARLRHPQRRRCGAPKRTHYRFAQIERKALIAVDGYRFNGTDYDRIDPITQLQEELPHCGPRSWSARCTETRTFARLGASPSTRPARSCGSRSLRRSPSTICCGSCSRPARLSCPRGIVRGRGGILLEHLKALGLCLDLGPRDSFCFHCSTSWMASNHLVGGLLHGSTVVLYNGSPGHGAVDALWRVCTATEANVLGMGFVYVIACEKGGLEVDRGALRIVIPTGSPLPPSGWRWLHRQLGGDVRIDSICGSTDVCTAFFGGSELLPVHSGEISCRWLGVDARALDSAGNELVGELGEFVVTAPMPSMPIGLWNDPEGSRIRAAYFELYPGVWRQGGLDQGLLDRRHYRLRSLGRDTGGGVRLGSAETYGAVERLAEVADSLVVGVELSAGVLHAAVRRVAGAGSRGAEVFNPACDPRRAIAALRPGRDRDRSGDPPDAFGQEARGADQANPAGRPARASGGRRLGRPSRRASLVCRLRFEATKALAATRP